MKVTVLTDGQVVLPKEFREQDQIGPGQQFEIERRGDGHYLLSRIPVAANTGLIDWLLSCPEKDWFNAESPDMQ